jgi:hypothetical protein
MGAIEYIAFDQELQLHKQMANLAKGFVTDKKLHDWGLYQIGKQHARDAIRHAVYYLLFKVANVQIIGGDRGKDPKVS